MLRFIYVILLNLFRAPYMIPKMRREADHPEKYSAEERYELARHCIRLMKVTGGIHTKAYGQENLPKENLRLIDEELDLAGWDVDSFNRRLDMKEGIFYRDMEVTSPRGNQLRIHVEHITNMARPNLCLIKYSVSDRKSVV